MSLSSPVLAIVMLLGSPAAWALDQRCADYADHAVHQAEVVRELPSCAGASGQRWTTDFSVHYDWCLRVSERDPEAERQARSNWLRACH